jgi:DNA-binding GntR family transcriptional regulator
VDLAYDAVKNDILSKRLIPGRKIVPSELSARYEISETPIKQALNRLITEGLIESLPRRGMVVKQMSVTGLMEMMQARRMIELFSVPYAIERIRKDPAFLPQLEKNTADIEESLRTADGLDYFSSQNRFDTQFHLLLVGTMENRRVFDFYTQLGTHLLVFYLYGVKTMDRFWESLDEHKAILGRLQRLDRAGMEQAILHHLEKTEQDSKKNLDIVLKNCSEYTPSVTNMVFHGGKAP